MKSIVFIFLFLFAFASYAQQQETFDQATYVSPKGWKKISSTDNVVSYAITNNQKGTYCQIGIYKTTISKGNLQADFESEWEELIVKTYKPTEKPRLVPSASENGWNAQGGSAPFEFSGAQSVAMLVTMSGYGRCMSIVILTNTEDYQRTIETFLESVDLKKPETTSQPATDNMEDLPGNEITQKPEDVPNSVGTGYQFSTTNFDDGWTSTIQEDWVQITKGNIVVLLHYGTNKIDLSSADHVTISNNAWNALVAPRYRNLANYHVLGATLGYQRPSLISGDVTDNETGTRLHVSLFHKGGSNWIEIIGPDKQSFINVFGVDGTKVDYYADDNIWNTLLKLPTYNKFAVSASDLTGKWTNDFSGSLQYVNVYTGADAGMTSHASNEKFEFGPGNTYQWNLGVASGQVGNLKFQSVKSTGTFSLPNNWQVTFSDIEGKPKTYDAFFSCVKGARMLWFGDTGFGRIE